MYRTKRICTHFEGKELKKKTESTWRQYLIQKYSLTLYYRQSFSMLGIHWNGYLIFSIYESVEYNLILGWIKLIFLFWFSFWCVEIFFPKFGGDFNVCNNRHNDLSIINWFVNVWCHQISTWRIELYISRYALFRCIDIADGEFKISLQWNINIFLVFYGNFRHVFIMKQNIKLYNVSLLANWKVSRDAIILIQIFRFLFSGSINNISDI